MNNQGNTFGLWQQELELINTIKAQRPELFERRKKLVQSEVLRHIGVETIPDDLPQGFYRLFPQDFIVEEITSAGDLCTVQPDPQTSAIPGSDRRTLYCHLVKVGMYTLEAQQRIAHALGIERERIGYAGIKDAVALTSQRISLRNVRHDEISGISIPGLFLKNFSYGKGTVTVGDLQGNRFTILVRTEHAVPSDWFAHCMQGLSEQGFLNYYGIQRFGSRMSVHLFGKRILQGKYEEAIREFLTMSNLAEPPYLAEIRMSGNNLFGQWSAMRKRYEQFPYSLRTEIKLLNYLETNPDNVVGALASIGEQVRLWIYAYVSYVFNKTLSRIAHTGSLLPETLPLLISNDPSDHAVYAQYLEEDGTANFVHNLRPLPFIRLDKREVDTVIVPQVNGYRILPEGVAMSFSLPRAAYATTMLMNLFQLSSGRTIPQWVKKTELDALDLLNLGSLDDVKKRLGAYIFTHHETEETEKEASAA